MAARTGTASQVNASAGSGSTSVTVPADCTAAVAFWSHFNTLGASTLSTLTLGGNAFTTRSEIACKTPASDTTGTGVATLTALPGTGTQTLAWGWSDSDARDEGGGLFLVYVKDVDTSDIYRDAKTLNQAGTSTISFSLTTITTDLVLGMGQSFSGTNPNLTATVFIDNASFNSELYDVSEITAGASSTTVQITSGDYPTIAGISLKTAPVAPDALPLMKQQFAPWARLGAFG